MAGALVMAGATLAGCQTTGAAASESRLVGQEVDAALGLYGPYDQFVTLAGRPTYVWRRHFAAGGQDYYCELRVETGFRRTISGSVMQGNPDACRLFAVQYKTARNN